MTPHAADLTRRSALRAGLPLLAALAVIPCAAANAARRPGGAAAQRGVPEATAVDVGEIEAFGFDSAVAMGVGGFLTTRIHPVVLFKNGDALTDIRGIAFAGGLTAHRSARPGAWTRWRRTGPQIEVRRRAGWAPLAFPATYPALPDGFRLDGRFRALTGAGTLAVGGAQEVTGWNEYRFWPDGRVERGGGAGARGAAAGGSAVTSATAPPRRGRYEVEGLTLAMSWDDGTAERRLLVTDPKDATAAIWLDGVGYARRDE